MNQPPRSGNKILYIYENQSSRPPLLQRRACPALAGETFLCSFSFILEASVDGWGAGGKIQEESKPSAGWSPEWG